MGICWCKQKNEDFELYLADSCNTWQENCIPNLNLEDTEKDYLDSEIVDNLVLETLGIIGTLVDKYYYYDAFSSLTKSICFVLFSEQEPPQSLLSLHNVADHEDGWIQVVKSMVHVIPMSDPLGPSVITLLLDDCPLPSRDSVLKVSKMFNLSTKRAFAGRTNAARERNICVILGCIAEKLAGPSSLGILSIGMLDYLITNLVLKHVDFN